MLLNLPGLFTLASTLAIHGLKRASAQPIVLLPLANGNFTLPPLPYAYDALAPAISEEIMKLHHLKHHAALVTGLNAAQAATQTAAASRDVLALIELQAQIKFNGGGHINHSLFWKNLAPESAGGGQIGNGVFAKAVQEQYGGLENLKTSVNAAAMKIQGSGWVWLALNQKERRLTITTTANQDPLTEPLVPLLGIDMWEHAFYLQHQNRKPDYLNNIWKVINFAEAEARLQSSIQS